MCEKGWQRDWHSPLRLRGFVQRACGTCGGRYLVHALMGADLCDGRGWEVGVRAVLVCRVVRLSSEFFFCWDGGGRGEGGNRLFRLVD